MAGHSRPKDGVASLAYVPAIHVLVLFLRKEDVDARHGLALGPAKGRTRVAGHDVERGEHHFATACAAFCNTVFGVA